MDHAGSLRAREVPYWWALGRADMMKEAYPGRNGAIAVKRSDFQKLAEVRIAEAEVLLKAKKYDGAYYLAGYAVECGLKACVAKRTARYDYPDKDLAYQCYTHKLQKLLELVGLHALLVAGSRLESNWVTVRDWDEQTRYERKTRLEAEGLFLAITDPAHGVLPWIKSHW